MLIVETHYFIIMVYKDRTKHSDSERNYFQNLATLHTNTLKKWEKLNCICSYSFFHTYPVSVSLFILMILAKKTWYQKIFMQPEGIS